MLPGWLDIAKRKAENMRPSNIDFKIINIESLELPDSSFDRVISNFVLCSSFQYDRVVKEAFRVLKQVEGLPTIIPGPTTVFSPHYSTRYSLGTWSKNRPRALGSRERPMSYRSACILDTGTHS